MWPYRHLSTDGAASIFLSTTELDQSTLWPSWQRIVVSGPLIPWVPWAPPSKDMQLFRATSDLNKMEWLISHCSFLLSRKPVTLKINNTWEKVTQDRFFFLFYCFLVRRGCSWFTPGSVIRDHPWMSQGCLCGIGDWIQVLVNHFNP